MKWTGTFVVVLAVGRSGSTLLQGILNALPGVLVRGENNGFLLSLFSAHHALRAAQITWGGETTPPENPWYGAELLRPSLFRRAIAAMVIEQLCAGVDSGKYRAIGFKEIRWLPEDLQGINLHVFLSFIEQTFERVQFLLLTRDVEQILKSGWWPSKDQDKARRDILGFYECAAVAPVKNLFRIDYSDLVPGTAALKNLCELMGGRYGEEIEAVLARPHSFKSA